MHPSRKADNTALVATMGTTYAMGTFNDNFFKQAAILLAGTAGLESLQGIATVLFALPFVVCSAWAGWLADRLPKSRLVLWSKFMELAAMLLGLVSLWALSWTGIVLVICLMGLQSTFFSPALNGSIPENFSASRVPRVNALLKLVTTATILLGIACAGLVLDLPAPNWSLSLIPPSAFGAVAVGIVALGVSGIGLITALLLRRSPDPVGRAPFPLAGPLTSVMHTASVYKNNPRFFLVLIGESFFYAVSSFVVLCLANLGVVQLGFSYAATSALSVALMVGVCVGAAVAGGKDASVWKHLMSPCILGMGSGLILAASCLFLPEGFRLVWLIAALLLTGVSGGLFLIPLVSTIQLTPAAHEKGKMLAVSNFMSFTGIILSGALFSLVAEVRPTLLLGITGWAVALLAIPCALLIRRLFPEHPVWTPFGTLLRMLLSLRYRVTVRGQEVLRGDGPILFLPNHPALIDPLLVYSRIAAWRPRPLSDERQMKGLPGKLARLLVNPVCIPDPLKDGASARAGVTRGLGQVRSALENGQSILLYPSGKIYRSPEEKIGAASATAALLSDLPQIRVILVRTTGLWGSSFSYASGKPPRFGSALMRGLVTLLGNGLFFSPRREVSMDFAEPDDLPRNADKMTLNRWLEEYYNAAPQDGVPVRRFLWQRGQAEEQRLRQQAEASGETLEISEDTRQTVYRLIKKAAQLDRNVPLSPDMTLAGDCSLDSLALMELALAIEEQTGHSVNDLENLVTVHDCLAAAIGQERQAGICVSEAWFQPRSSKELSVPGGASTIIQAFRQLVAREPNSVMLADASGTKTRRDVLTAALALSSHISRIPEQHAGILLPSTPAVVIAWLACLLAGKTPVLFNWTVGEANLRHCIDLTAVRTIITSSRLLDRVERQGLAVRDLPVAWSALEDMAASLSLSAKLSAAIRARLPRLGRSGNASDVAAVLFTSGSESRPKAVPLTHQNLLTNAADIIAALKITADNSILAMLPPFHSFGLMAGLVLPLSLGLRAAYHPNPTESGQLAAMVRAFQLSLVATPPTFLRAIMDKAEDGALNSLRYAFVGAEKCPEDVYTRFAALCPEAALCEGYGITECSPVVSVNRPDAVKAGSIGHLLPSVQAVIVREEDGRIAAEAESGQTGMLLVRGPSIFGGYLGDAPNPFVAHAGHTWYRTGDLVRMDETGRLSFQGRLKRFVKIGGEMVSLPQIEEVLLSEFAGKTDPEAGPAIAVEAGPEEAGAPLVLFTTIPGLRAGEVTNLLRKNGLSALYAIRRVEEIAAIPLLGSGKTDYQALKRLI